MKIFKSIKWRLQLWYGVILVVVLAGFGGTAYQLERSRQFRQIDEELHRRVGVLANALHRPPMRGPNGNRWQPGPGQPGQPGQPPRGQKFGEPPPEEPPADGQFGGQDFPGRPGRRPPGFNLPAQEAHLFAADDPHHFYYRIVNRDGDQISVSTNPPAKHPVNPNNEQQSTTRAAGIFGKANLDVKRMSFDHYREVSAQLPSDEVITVGCQILPELKELRRTAVNLFAVGGGVLLLGLAGGWWLVSRAIKPINEISATAVKISAGDLARRINVADTESELGELAVVLNSTFARLETAFAQQKQFASDAAHELRTPVTVMLTQTQTALARERDAAGYRQTVEACQRAAQRMRKLIETLLALARFDAGQEVLRRQVFDFAQTIADCAELVQPLAEERSVKLLVEVSPLEITGDPERLAQVVTNLLTNAIQYNQPEGEVRVQLSAADGLAVLTVADTGQGIAPEDLPQVFGRFFRADSSRTGAGNSGLGLAICQAIVTAHGGTIEVASVEAAGTTFTVRLPV